MSSAAPPVIRGSELELELLDPNSETLVRLFSHPGGDWDPPDAKYRNLRVDPPAGHKDDYAVLYMGNTLPTVAIECHILSADAMDRYTWLTERAKRYRVVRYTLDGPAVFMPIDGARNRSALGLAGGQRKFAGYEPYQEVAHALFRRYGNVIHGLSWESFHRNQPGRVYALWHHHKPTVGLRITSANPYPLLIEDNEWNSFLAANPDIDEIR
ncbi:RES domain-containing protein [Caballeronia sp. RCC_10]|uniref:RES domain-containing protein n=1 Tax=Caballeronia sp. RCC_10 TaxID=3239227 RepID=UPI0035247653